ncbi:MAG: hypothetical protein LUC89_04400 [Oscillospiraceae bacterium]|nr:hypothetical protein [Oscillospiraceae bacterium]
MEITSRQIKANDILFFMSYGLFLFFGILSTSFYYQFFMGAAYKLVKAFCVAVLLLREFTGRGWSLRSILIGGVLAVLMMLAKISGGSFTIAFIVIFLFCARDVSFEKIAKFTAWVSAVTVAFIVASAYLGIIENYVTVEERTRYYLGFRYALYGPVFLFNITGLILYIRKERIRWGELLVLVALNYWMFAETNSRLSFYLSIFMIVVFAVMKLYPRFFEVNQILVFLMMFSFVLCCAVSIYFTAIYDGSVTWQAQLNSALGGRLSLGKSALTEYGVNLFGQKIELVGNGLDAYGNKNTTDAYNYVDSFYIQILLRYGAVFLIVWIGILTYTLYRCYKMNNYALMVCLTFVAIHCVIDDLSLQLYYNTFWLACAVVLKKPKECRAIEKTENQYIVPRRKLVLKW